jgi:hypothetical protein
VFRIDGNHVQRLRGWTIAAEYVGSSGQAVTAEELVEALPGLYGVVPTGRPATS